MFYAQINESNICVAVSNLTGKVQDDKLIPIASMSHGLLGKKYENGKWVEVPTPEPEPTQLDNIEEQLNALTADSVTIEKLNAAISEGVNEV